MVLIKSGRRRVAPRQTLGLHFFQQKVKEDGNIYLPRKIMTHLTITSTKDLTNIFYVT